MGGPLVLHRMLSTLRHYLEYNQFITVEPYQERKVYDLLVTNNPACSSTTTCQYYLKNDLDQRDLAEIRRLI